MDERPELSAADYTVFGLILAVCVSIGIYFGCTGRKQRSTKEYLLADRRMPAIPVAASIMASNMSAIATLGSTAEAYMYSSVYSWQAVGVMILMPIAAHLYLSVYYSLNIISVYEYLEMRFSKPVRLVATIIYVIYKLLYLSLVIYAPALALSAVTDLNVWVVTVTVGLVCTLYTTVGGMKAVIWTDVIQMILMFTGVLIVIIKGAVLMGGFENVWRIADKGGRIQYVNFDFDPKIRNTVWTGTFGFALTMIPSLGVSQQIVQRFNSCRSVREGVKAIYFAMAFMAMYLLFATLPGIIIYAVYADCDPLREGRIKKPDQVMAYFVIHHLRNLPGIPGLFIAAIFSGALSTLSSGLNSLAAVTLEDFLKPCRCFKDMSDKRATFILKVISAFYGILAVASVYFVSEIGTLVKVALTLSGILLGPIFGVFTLGLFFPWTHTKGVMVGLVAGIGLGAVIGVGTFMYDTKQPPLPTSIEGCPSENISLALTNLTTIMMTDFTNTEVPVEMSLSTGSPPMGPDEPTGFISFLSMSHLWYSWLVVTTTVVVGLLASFITGYKKAKNVNPNLISPLYRKCCTCLPSWCCPPWYDVTEREDNALAPKGTVGIDNDEDVSEQPMSSDVGTQTPPGTGDIENA